MPKEGLDHTDIQILNWLQKDASLGNNGLAKKLGIAPSSCLYRVRRLEKLGLLHSSKWLMDYTKAGYSKQAFLRLGCPDSPELLKQVQAAILNNKQIEEAFQLDKAADSLTVYFRLRVFFRDQEEAKDWFKHHFLEKGLALSMEVEWVGNTIKDRQGIRLSHKDLPVLKQLKS